MSSLTKDQKKGAASCLKELLKVLSLEKCIEAEHKDISKRFMKYCREIVGDYEHVEMKVESESDEEEVPDKKKATVKKSNLKSTTSKKKSDEEDGDSIAAKKKIVLIVPKKASKKKSSA